MFTSISPLRWSFLGERLGELVFPELCFKKNVFRSDSYVSPALSSLAEIGGETVTENFGKSFSFLGSFLAGEWVSLARFFFFRQVLGRVSMC